MTVRRFNVILTRILRIILLVGKAETCFWCDCIATATPTLFKARLGVSVMNPINSY